MLIRFACSFMRYTSPPIRSFCGMRALYQACELQNHGWMLSIKNKSVAKSVPGPLTRYPKVGVAHAAGMPGTFSPPPWVSDPDMHQGTCVTHVPWWMPGSLTSGFLWSRHSRRMRKPQFCVPVKRPIAITIHSGHPWNNVFIIYFRPLTPINSMSI